MTDATAAAPSPPPAPGSARNSTASRLFSVTRSGVLLIFIGHLLACVVVLFFMPGGWPAGSAAFISHRVLPIAVGLMLLAAMTNLPSRGVDRIALAYLAGSWLCAVALPLVMFPVSGPRLALGASAAAIVMLLALAAACRRAEKVQLKRLLASATVGAVIAIVPLRSLRSPPISTRPAGVGYDAVLAGAAERRTLRLDQTFALDPTQATVTVAAGRRYAYVEPVLTFVQRSPDACWTIFAPKRDRLPSTRVLASTTQRADGIDAGYIDQDHAGPVAEHRLYLRRLEDRAVTVEALSSVRRPVWSHLNTFTQVTVAGHRDLRVRFSAATEAAIEVKNAGYPAGAPARFAYVDRDRVLHIVEASSAEKGPFRELASGKIDGPLTLMMLDGEEAFLELTFDDWAEQASVEASPTAGWGVPQNAIEFSRLSEDPKSPASFFITLASTSVGRGWNSVGHGPGVYRNRMTIRVPATP